MKRAVRGLLAAVGLAAVMGLAALGAAPAQAQAVPAKTRVYVVVIDGLRPDEVASMPFLASLASTGSYYTQGRGVMVAETIPNHVAMVTGVYPDRNGIVANSFPDTATGKVREAGDPALLTADSMFTLVEKQCPQLTTAAVTSKDYLYTIMNHDRTGDGKVDADINFNNTKDPTFIPGLGLTPDERTIVEATQVARSADPDFLFVNLGSVDRVGHVDPLGGTFTLTGTEPPFRAAQRTLTDAYLRVFVETLKAAGTWNSTALLVTADHSMDWSLPGSSVTLTPAFQADPLLKDQVLTAQNGGAGLYSLKDRGSPQAAARLAKMRQIAVATAGVDEALYREPNALDGGTANSVGAVHPDWHQTGVNSGDLLVTVKDSRRISEPTAVTSNPIPGNHGMASTLRVPIIVNGGLGVVPRTVVGDPSPFVRAADQAENVDMAPTAAWLLGVAPPTGGFDGRPLTEAFRAQPAPACVSPVGLGALASPSPGVSPAVDPGGGDPSSAAGLRSGRSLAVTGLEWGVPALGGLLLAAAGLVRRHRAR